MNRVFFPWSAACVFVLLACLVAPLSVARAAEPFALSSGDRIAMIGGTFIEREVRYGCIETLMTAHFSDHDLTFRNLGWSGDTVTGIARASFDSVEKGYERLIKQVVDAKPTVIFVSYGQNESFEGEAGLDTFLSGLNKLLDDVAETEARIVLISPTLLENLGAPLPDPAAHNAEVKLYTEAIAKLAEERKLYFVDMTALLPVSKTVATQARTDNGMHFTEAGYWQVASALMQGMGYATKPAKPKTLEPLRTVIVEKNRLFFNQWRPQNETYLFGFRKHEQGQYGEEIPLFDPLIENLEKQIVAERNQLSPATGKGSPAQ